MEELFSNSDAEILQKFLEKDERAFEAIYSRFYGQLCYFGEKLVMSQPAAEEIVIDVFINTFRKEIAFNNMRHLQGYLFEAVKNHAINFLKREKRYADHLKRYFDSIVVNIGQAGNEQPEARTLALIFQAAESLPTECRKVFELLYKHQKNYKEIAESLELNIQTVRNQHSRAIAHIRKKLNQSCL